MSTAPQPRRADKALADEETLDLLARGFAGRLATVGPDGCPYITPLLYVWRDGEIWVHNAAARGHLRTNVEHGAPVCFEVDEPGEVFAYGRFECDTSVAYRSVVAFGAIRIVEDRGAKEAFCVDLMAKYGPRDDTRPAGFFPRLAAITVYAITVDRFTGKHTPLPALSEQWPAMDRSATPDARGPGAG